MKNGDVTYAETHAEFLNKVFGTNYKAWMKCTWQYGYWTVWMVRFNEEDGGWNNTFEENRQRIREENLDAGKTCSKNTALRNVDKTKIVIEIDDTGFNKKYIFRGIYKYDEEKSNPNTVRYYNKISDEL